VFPHGEIRTAVTSRLRRMANDWSTSEQYINWTAEKHAGREAIRLDQE
jgi:hypothetical protein